MDQQLNMVPETERELMFVMYHQLQTVQTDLREIRADMKTDTKEIKNEVAGLKTFKDRVTFLVFPIWTLLVVVFGAWVKGLFG